MLLFKPHEVVELLKLQTTAKPALLVLHLQLVDVQELTQPLMFAR